MKLIILFVLCATAFADFSADIVGGKDAAYGMFPHMVAVRHSETLICGGALIGLQWVLTSAECVWEYQGTEYAYSVYVGGLWIIGDEPGRISVGVDRIYPHPNFKTRDTLYYSNIGLMHLSFPVTPSPSIGIAHLSSSALNILPGTIGELAGWGGTNARVSPRLQWAQMVTMSIDSCTIAVGGGVNFNDSQICTNANPGPSACWYDHGGALVDRKNPLGTVILGVTAYAGCLDPQHPTIYTNAAFFIPWIQSITGIVPLP